jgi:hypothetical protein
LAIYFSSAHHNIRAPTTYACSTDWLLATSN